MDSTNRSSLNIKIKTKLTGKTQELPEINPVKAVKLPEIPLPHPGNADESKSFEEESDLFESVKRSIKELIKLYNRIKRNRQKKSKSLSKCEQKIKFYSKVQLHVEKISQSNPNPNKLLIDSLLLLGDYLEQKYCKLMSGTKSKECDKMIKVLVNQSGRLMNTVSDECDQNLLKIFNKYSANKEHIGSAAFIEFFHRTTSLLELLVDSPSYIKSYGLKIYQEFSEPELGMNSEYFKLALMKFADGYFNLKYDLMKKTKYHKLQPYEKLEILSKLVGDGQDIVFISRRQSDPHSKRLSNKDVVCNLNKKNFKQGNMAKWELKRSSHAIHMNRGLYNSEIPYLNHKQTFK